VVGLRGLVALFDVGVGVGVVTVGGDGVVVVVCRGVREGRVGAGFERTTKMESENESENDHFCKSEGRV